MKASLQAKMGQSMTLTPQLLQSIRLLQVSSLQLEQELQLVLERNPLLEQESDEDEPAAAGEGDTAALEARLARIPAERQQEAEAIETRYAKLNDRTFPVAVIFLVPESAAQGGAA